MCKESAEKVRIALAEEDDRPLIYRMRHDVYAAELGQCEVRQDGMLSDGLDGGNVYIVAKIAGELAGFISITPPELGRYSIEKYVRRDELPLMLDDRTYEVRVLTVSPAHRNSGIASYLMYGAFRWVEEHGGEQIIAMGRDEVLSIYQNFGAQLLGRRIVAGSVYYELMKTSVSELQRFSMRERALLERLQARVEWELGFSFSKAPCCFHGGAFFESIGAGFETLSRRAEVMNADVLDAWFPPSPRALATLDEHLPWLMRTSPPTQCEGLRDAIARYRAVRAKNVLPGAGSSDLIYRAFRHWLDRKSRVLILDPMYGEYQHVLERVIGCRVERLMLSRRDGYQVDANELAWKIREGFDLVVLVNPNNPTGRHVQRAELERVVRRAPAETRVWIDEAYIDYVGSAESLERLAAESENVVVCKTMSKGYALSGMRVGYMCGSPRQLAELETITPPWIVGLPAQVAAVRALENPAYYAERYAETHRLRLEMKDSLRRLGINEIVPGEANFLMFHLDDSQLSAKAVIEAAKKADVFMRDVAGMGTGLGERALRIAIKDRASNERVLQVLERILSRKKVSGPVGEAIAIAR
ncbi:aminotransferase class I/II-fold pyridoxal phosphate-dependent enzyme [Occallatibacter savannae]|uniref:aminotransferase class I/II-fold pyridoxal phosphate-dependent enzyme n=1 Tax=Occallatibacter savannae TaxID=1002691 RepID=UPI0013A52DE7|nr:aminotransferase class I/II-fold pyridoxal phosphate-dependent enzyme [Occallatibacter savannae]